MLMSTFPKTDDIDWSMDDICDSNEIDRGDIQTDEERTRYRAILDTFETTVFDQQSEETTSKFLFEVLILFCHILTLISSKCKRSNTPILMLLFGFFKRFILTILNFHAKIQLNGH